MVGCGKVDVGIGCILSVWFVFLKMVCVKLF